MEVLKYNFPTIKGVDMAFPTFDAPKELLEEAKNRGFYNGRTKWNDFFSKWFFTGLDKAPSIRKEVDKDLAHKAMLFAVCLMKSFTPKHEAKEAVCALIFSECLELPNEN